MGNLQWFGVRGNIGGLKWFSRDHFAEKYLKINMPKQKATVPICALVDRTFEKIKVKSVQIMQFCYVHREGVYRRLRYI